MRLCLTNNDFAREISIGNLRTETSKELQTMQHHLNQGERTLVKNALSVLDASFRDVEDFAGNPSRLAARTLYLRTLTKALRENDTQLLVMLTNKRHVEAVGRSFRGIDVAKDEHEINTASEVSQSEEGVVLMERPLAGLEALYSKDLNSTSLFRHEHFFSSDLSNHDNFGLFPDGVKAENPQNRKLYIQKDKRVFKKKYINMARAELEQDAIFNAKITEFMANFAAVGEDMDLEAAPYALFGKNCKDYAQEIIRRAEKIAKLHNDSLYLK